MNETDKKNRKSSGPGCFPVLFILLMMSYFLITPVFGVISRKLNNMEQLRYDIMKSEGMAKVEVLEVFKQKDKETLYKVQITYDDAGFPDSFWARDTVTLTESEYLQHIGEGNNAFTVKLESLYIFKSNSGSPIELLLDANFDVEKGYEPQGRAFHFLMLPWEKEKHFTDEDVIKAAEQVLNQSLWR